MYRSRPRGILDQEVLNFLSSIKDDFPIFNYDILGSEAHVIMLHEIGYLSKQELVDILTTLEEAKVHREEIMKASKFEDIHESLEAFVVEKIGLDKGGMLQTARSRNDQVMVDLKMEVRDEINNICVQLADLIDSLLVKADSNIDTVMLLYTHLQQAQIGTFSHYLLSYAESLFRDMERLSQTYDRINQSPLGSSAIGGSTFAVNRNRTAALLGFDQLIPNSIDATSSRDMILEYLSCISIIMITLSRISEDFILWATTEFAYIELTDAASSTSSAMPQKKNPDPLELLRSKSARTLGNLTASLTILKGLPSGYNRDLQELKNLVFQSYATVKQSIRIMRLVIESCVVHKSRMLEVATLSFANSVDVAELLASSEHIPFRSAHKLVGSLVDTAIKRGKHTLGSLKEGEIDQYLKSVKSPLKAGKLKALIEACSATRCLKLRMSKGSPNRAEQVEMILQNNKRLRDFRRITEKRQKAIQTAYDNLSKIVVSFTSGLKHNPTVEYNDNQD